MYHGADLDGLPSSAHGGPGLVAFGRVHPDKGDHTATEIARLAGGRLTICGIVQDDRYFTGQVAPRIDGERVVSRFGRPEATRGDHWRGGALLHPIAFDEPFGLSVVESMACGAPVVAYRRGSMPEVVDEGVTGFLVHAAQQAAATVAGIATVDRGRLPGQCRTAFQRRPDGRRLPVHLPGSLRRLPGLIGFDLPGHS